MSIAQAASLLSAVVLASALGACGGPSSGPAVGLDELVSGNPNDGSDVGRGQLVSTTAVPGGRDRFGLAAARGYLYLVGGRLDPAFGSSRADVFAASIGHDGSLGAWQQTAPLPVPRIVDAIATDGRSLFVIGGCPQFCADNELEETKRVFRGTLADDGSVVAWEESEPLPEPRYLHTALAHDGFVYVLGGAGTTTTFRASIGSDGRLSAWMPDQPLLKPRKQHASLVLGKHVYVGGGNQQSPVTWWTDIEVSTIQADGSLGPWTTIPGDQFMLQGDLAEYAWAHETGAPRTSFADSLPLSGERTQLVIEDRIYEIYRYQDQGPAPAAPHQTPVVFVRFR